MTSDVDIQTEDSERASDVDTQTKDSERAATYFPKSRYRPPGRWSAVGVQKDLQAGELEQFSKLTVERQVEVMRTARQQQIGLDSTGLWGRLTSLAKAVLTGGGAGGVVALLVTEGTDSLVGSWGAAVVLALAAGVTLALVSAGAADEKRVRRAGERIAGYWGAAKPAAREQFLEERTLASLHAVQPGVRPDWS